MGGVSGFLGVGASELTAIVELCTSGASAVVAAITSGRINARRCIAGERCIDVISIRYFDRDMIFPPAADHLAKKKVRRRSQRWYRLGDLCG
jgi:hypothetical protein